MRAHSGGDARGPHHAALAAPVSSLVLRLATVEVAPSFERRRRGTLGRGEEALDVRVVAIVRQLVGAGHALVGDDAQGRRRARLVGCCGGVGPRGVQRDDRAADALFRALFALAAFRHVSFAFARLHASR